VGADKSRGNLCATSTKYGTTLKVNFVEISATDFPVAIFLFCDKMNTVARNKKTQILKLARSPYPNDRLQVARDAAISLISPRAIEKLAKDSDNEVRKAVTYNGEAQQILYETEIFKRLELRLINMRMLARKQS
jgi:hypothetical protein